MSPAHALSVVLRKAAAARRRTRARSIVARISQTDPTLLFGGVSPYAISHRHGPAWPSARAPRDYFARVFPESSRYAAAEADGILDGRVRLFGRVEDVSLGPGLLDWNWHPRDERAELFGADPKFPWELARHACLPRLGVAWFATRDSRYAEGAAAIMLDWVAHFSEPAGLHWESALEVGIRLTAWCQAFHFFRSAPAFKGPVIDAVLRHIAAMATWLEGNLSTDRVVAGNHLLGELAGLIVTDLYFPELGERNRLAGNIARFTAEVEKQVAVDGVSLEQSSTYGRFVGDFIVAVLGTARATGTALPNPLAGRAGALAGWLSALTRQDGTLPLIGDNDNGRGVDWGEPWPSNDARGVILALSALVDDPGPLSIFKGSRIPPGAETVFWWMGEEGLKRLDHLLRSSGAGEAVQDVRGAGGHTGAGAPVRHVMVGADRAVASVKHLVGGGPPGLAVTVTHFPAGGHAIVKSGPDFIHVRCGPFGHGLPKPSAHSHADWMSPAITLFGHELLVDPGNYGYTTVGPLRDLFRSDAVHSLFRVDDQPLAVPGDTFRWLAIPRSGRMEVTETPDEVRIMGAWTPAGRPEYKAVACARTVVYNIIQRFILIEDEWSGAALRGVSWRWRLPAAARITIGANGSDFGADLPGGARFSFELSPGAKTSVEEGWVAPRYAERIPAPVAVVERSAPVEPAGRQITVIRFLSGSGERPA